MMDINRFKKNVKEWMKQNPNGAKEQLADYCEELIGPNQFASHEWLIDHTLSWYDQVLKDRKNF